MNAKMLADRNMVVVIDNNLAERHQIAAAIEARYDVKDYAELDEAIIRLSGKHPAALIVDEKTRPPGRGGLVPTLRGVFSDVPIILCASPGWPQDGADVLLDKPFRRSRLISALSRVTNQAVEEGWNSLPAPHPQTLRKSIDTFNHITELIEVGEPLVYDRVVDVCAPLVDAVTGSQYKPLLNALQRHDNAHYVHSLRVATLLSLFGHSIGLKDDALLILATGGLLHDLGKTLEGLNIVNEPRRLTAQELKKVHWHVTSTLDYLEHHTDVPKGVRTIALLHHERLDGSGYPNGIKGAKLNDLARMAAIVDVYSALTERRSYRPALMAKDAFALMSTEMHASLDQRLLGIFRDLLENGACDA